jgi:hypothetical protein
VNVPAPAWHFIEDVRDTSTIGVHFLNELPDFVGHSHSVEWQLCNMAIVTRTARHGMGSVVVVIISSTPAR